MINLENFKEQVLSDVTQFELQIGDKNYYFVKSAVGRAKFVFGEYFYKKQNFSLTTKLQLVAIVADGNVYIVKTYDFYNSKFEIECPKNVFVFSDKLKEVNDYICNELFTKYYDNLPVRELTEDQLYSVKRDVRMNVLYNGGVVEELKIEKVLNEDYFVKVLCGEITIGGFAVEYFEIYKEGYITTKSMKHELRKLVDAHYNVEHWEIAMAKAVRELDAKTVTVDFCFNGQIGTEKVEKDNLLREIYNNGTFSNWDFANSKKGEALLKKLGAGRWSEDRKELTCKHIESIRYGKKVIYSKQSLLQKNA